LNIVELGRKEIVKQLVRRKVLQHKSQAAALHQMMIRGCARGIGHGFVMNGGGGRFIDHRKTRPPRAIAIIHFFVVERIELFVELAAGCQHGSIDDKHGNMAPVT
jgi:hypothetical protein